MKKTAIILAALLAGPALAEYVQGYTRKDGTYVPGHYRSESNSTKHDNYSTKGNYNPYTAEKGTVDPYKIDTTPSQPRSSYGTPQCYTTSTGRYVCR